MTWGAQSSRTKRTQPIIVFDFCWGGVGGGGVCRDQNTQEVNKNAVLTGLGNTKHMCSL